MTTGPDNLEPLGQAEESPPQRTRTRRLLNRVAVPIQEHASQALRWTRQEIILVFFAAFIAGLGAGAAQALITWALE